MPTVNDIGKPCAGESHARFDGRGLETECTYYTTAPALDPTCVAVSEGFRPLVAGAGVVS